MVIKLLATFLLAVSAYLGWWAVSAASLLWLLPSVVTLVAAVGLFLSKRWAKYLWHVLATLASLSWLISVGCVVISGWPYDSTLLSLISLTPGLFLVAVCIGGSIVVDKHFRGNQNAL